MTTKSIIWNQLKTDYEYSSSFLNKLYGVTYQQASKELLESILAMLQNEVGTGVNDSLSSECGGVTVATINQSETLVNSANATKSIKGQEYKLFLPEVIPSIVEKLDDNNTYKVDRGTGHTPVVYHLCVDNKDGQTKLLVIIGSWIALSTIEMYYRDNLISKPETTNTIVATETSDNVTTFKGIQIEHVTCDDIGLDYPETTSEVLITMHQMPTVTYFLVDNSEDVLQFNSLTNAIKKAKQWLSTEDEQIKQVSNQIA